MKVLVAYFSETGNTEKLAKAIYEGVGNAEKEILPLGEVKDVAPYDLIFCGFPVHVSSVPVKVQPFLRGIPKGKKLAVFATHGSLRKGPLAVAAFDYAMSLASNAKVIGTFGCRGKVKPSLLEQLMKKPEHRAWAEQAQSAASSPNEEDLEDGRDFANEMMKKVR